MMSEFTYSNLSSVFDYNSKTGIIRWKVSNGKSVKEGDEAGYIRYDGYRNISYKYKNIPAHHIAWLFITGNFPEKHIDHINGNRSDNRETNLREVTFKENHKNKKLPENNKSGVIGVSMYMKSLKWQSQIRVNGKQIHLGYYEDFEEAVKVRLEAEKKYGFHINHGRK